MERSGPSDNPLGSKTIHRTASLASNRVAAAGLFDSATVRERAAPERDPWQLHSRWPSRLGGALFARSYIGDSDISKWQSRSDRRAGPAGRREFSSGNRCESNRFLPSDQRRVGGVHPPASRVVRRAGTTAPYARRHQRCVRGESVGGLVLASWQMTATHGFRL